MSSPVRAGERGKRWTRSNIIEALREYAELYGPGFTASAFSPSTARWRDETEAIDRYYAGRADGSPWPSLNAVKAEFGGSFNAAREAAGLPANRPGPAKGRRPAGEHRPQRDLSSAKATRIIYVEKDTDGELDRLRAEVLRLRDRVRDRPVIVKTKTKTVTRTREDRVSLRRMERRLVRAEASAADAGAALDAAETRVREREADAREARTAAVRMAARLERAEASIAELRAERRALKRERDRAQDRLVAERAVRAEPQVEVETKVIEKVVREESPGAAAVREAVAAAALADRRVLAAEMRAATAEREYQQLASAAVGEPRKLTNVEMRELAASGPSGPAILAGALRALGKARAHGTKMELGVALLNVARAAVSWRERL